MEIYDNKKVVSWESSEPGVYDGVVSGSGDNTYTVHVDTVHPRKSICNCPFADGRRVVCKHMIALYFTAEPKAAKDFLKKVEKWEAEEEERDSIKIRRNGLRVPILRLFIWVILIQISVYEDKIYIWNDDEMPSGLDSYV